MKNNFIIALALLVVSCQNSSNNEDAIFSPGKVWKYNSVFKNGEEITLDSFTLKTEKGSIFITQQKIMYLYETLLPNGSIRSVEETTGVVENKGKVWLHPPRSERYEFTQITPFPEIVFNETEWKRRVNITKHASYSGSVESNYQSLGYRDTTINNVSYDSLHCISATSKSNHGNYNAIFYFHNKMGFVFLYYKKQEGEEVFIYLKELIEGN